MQLNGDEKRTYEWQAPPREATGEYRAGWLNELTANGDQWVQSRLPNLQKDVKLLMGIDQERDLESNILQPDIRTFVETISDLRQIATLGARAPQWKKTVATYNDVFKFVYWDSHFVPSSRKALQYAMLGRAYMWQKFTRTHYGLGPSKIVFDWMGPREGLPEQLPPDNDVQGCYAFTFVRPMPIAEAHARFPQFQQWLQPISRYDWKSYGTLGMLRRYDFYDRFRFGDEGWGNGWENRFTEVRFTFCRDLRINTTGFMQQMGVDGTTWGYKVPSLGDLVVTVNAETGLPESHKVTPEEARMYPQLRLMISSPSVPIPMYDDTAFSWHGEIPAVQYDVCDWAWSALGQSAVSNVRGLEVARRDRISDINTVLAVRKDPPLGHDVSAGVSRTQMDKLDLLHAQGVRMGGRGDPGKWTKSILPPEINVDANDFSGVELLSKAIKDTLGLSDITSLREVNMNMSESSLEKFIENIGPMGKAIAISLWVANYKHAHMLKYNIAQHFTVDDLVSMVGPDGVGLETYDHDPNSLVPSHLPGEPESESSKYEKRDRARWFVERMKVISTPTQLLNITHVQEAMRYMMFLQQNQVVKMSMDTIMSKLGVDDYEVQHEKWWQEQIQDAEKGIETQAAAQAYMQKLGIQPPEPPGAQGQGKGGGRPYSDEKPPHLEQKGAHGGKVRAVLSTS